MVIVWVLVYWLDLILVDELMGNFDSVNGENILVLLCELMDEMKMVLVLVMYSEEVVVICY